MGYINHSVKYVNHSVEYINHSVKQRIYFDVLQKCVWNKVVFDGLYAKCRGGCGENNRLMEVKYKKTVLFIVFSTLVNKSYQKAYSSHLK